MRFAFLSPFSPYRGGISRFSGRLLKALRSAGHYVEAFNFSRQYPGLLFPGKSQYEDNTVNVDGFESKRILDSISPVSYRRTVKAIRECRPDVLIIAYWMSFLSPAYSHVARQLKGECKVIALVHNAIPHEPRFFDKTLARRFFRHCCGFIALSENVHRDILSLCPGAKCLVHPHPLYDNYKPKLDRKEACSKLGIPSSRKNLLFFGLIRDYKGLDILLEAFGKLDDSYSLIIAGECYGSFEKYDAAIGASPGKDRIYVHSVYISEDDVPLYFSAADALVLPYRSATQSGVVSMAYNYDLPMVATPVGDFAESIEKAGAGVLSSDFSADGLATAIGRLFPPERLKLTHENLKKAKAGLTWESLVAGISGFLA